MAVANLVQQFFLGETGLMNHPVYCMHNCIDIVYSIICFDLTIYSSICNHVNRLCFISSKNSSLEKKVIFCILIHKKKHMNRFNLIIG